MENDNVVPTALLAMCMTDLALAAERAADLSKEVGRSDLTAWLASVIDGCKAHAGIAQSALEALDQ